MNLAQQSSKQGAALIVVLSVIVTLSVTVVVAMEYTAMVRHQVQRSEGLQSAIGIGDGVLDHAFGYWREICRSNTDASLHTSSFTNIPLPTQSQFPTVQGFSAQRAPINNVLGQMPTVSNFQVIAVDPQMNPIDDAALLIPAIGQSPVTATYSYLGEADVSLPVLDGYVTTKVRRVFQKQQLSPWNWAIFYVDPLEIHPGAAMNVTGWVHSNGTLYTGHNLLTFQSKVTYGTDWVIGFEPGKRYYDQAGVKILINSSNTVTIKDQNDNVLGPWSTGNAGAIYSTFSSAITTNQTIQDNREGASVRLATLDMGAVNTAIQNGSLGPFNNIIYVSDTSASTTGGTPKRGIRLQNGAIMPSNGITVASQNPVYIQGDYNTGGSNPPSNSGNYAQPQVTGYTRAPCAVVADAVNILSNSWNDSNSSSTLGSRAASNTTVNTAIVSGIVPSANNNYSGGAENFPRFLEDWTGKSFTYYGSMVELYKSAQSIGKWGSGNVYNPPNRQWFFDTNLQVYTPPGSLPVYSYIKGRWFEAQ
jgi:hypothetical protein